MGTTETQINDPHDVQRPQHLASPWGLKWRSSVWFVTTVVGCGIATDLLIYSIVIPVVPFQLERLGYTGVSKLTGWLLLAYSGGIVVSTFPIAAFSERYKSRQIPFILGLVLLVGSQIMFMEAPTYWVMVIARIIQGFSSTIVWVVGLALLCDTVPERHVGKQLGLAMGGLTFGLLLGAPVGGALYGSFGFRGPFIFGIIITLLDLVGRLLVIERRDALKYGWDPTLQLTAFRDDIEGEKNEDPLDTTAQPTPDRPTEKSAVAEASDTRKSDADIEPAPIPASHMPGSSEAMSPPSLTLQESPKTLKHSSQWKAIVLLAKSPRAMTAFFNCFIEGIALTAIEPGFPLHMQRVWGYDSTKVGLVSIAAVIPTIFSSPLAGWLSDHAGTEYVVLACMLGSIPFYIIAVIPKSVVLFIFAYACISFFISGCIAPLMADLAAVGHLTDGVGFAHVYGAFNIAYGLGSAVGPVIGGLAYDHHGWSLVCYICVAALAVGAVASFCFGGAEPLLKKLRKRLASKSQIASDVA